jgi:hypothetical protein
VAVVYGNIWRYRRRQRLTGEQLREEDEHLDGNVDIW